MNFHHFCPKSFILAKKMDDFWSFSALIIVCRLYSAKGSFRR
eukprot:UN13586